VHIGKKIKLTGLYYASGGKLDQMPEFWKNSVMTLSSCIYECGTTRYKGRIKELAATESPKIELKKKEEYSYEEKSLEESVQTGRDFNSLPH
jgi:hypothetical protein